VGHLSCAFHPNSLVYFSKCFQIMRNVLLLGVGQLLNDFFETVFTRKTDIDITPEMVATL